MPGSLKVSLVGKLSHVGEEVFVLCSPDSRCLRVVFDESVDTEFAGDHDGDVAVKGELDFYKDNIPYLRVTEQDAVVVA